MRTSSPHTGFTLLELLIVISIIVILATMGVGSYSRSRQVVATDIQADKLISMLHSLRDKSQSRQRCVGVEFAPNTPPILVEAPFVDPRQGCGEKDSVTTLQWDTLTHLEEITVDTQEQTALSLWFTPPHGKMLLTPPGQNATIHIASRSSKSVSIREVAFNILAGSFTKRSIQEPINQTYIASSDTQKSTVPTTSPAPTPAPTETSRPRPTPTAPDVPKPIQKPATTSSTSPVLSIPPAQPVPTPTPDTPQAAEILPTPSFAPAIQIAPQDAEPTPVEEKATQVVAPTPAPQKTPWGLKLGLIILLAALAYFAIRKKNSPPHNSDKKNPRGFTLIETILAITVITLVITAASELASSSLRLGRVSVAEFAAYHLAEEGIEITRNIRDSNWLRNQSWDASLAAGTYIVQEKSALGGNGYPWELIKVADLDHVPDVALTPNQRYTRTVEISYTPAHDQTMNITSLVKWDDVGVPKTVTVNAQLTDWKKGPL